MGGRRAWTVSMISVLSMPLQVDRGDAEVGVAELSLDDDQRDAFAGHLDGVRVAELMGCEAPPDTGLRGGVAQLGARRAGRPCAAASRAGRDAQQRTDWKVDARGEPWLNLLPGPVVHADLPAATALAAAHEQRAAPRMKVRLAEGEGLVDPHARAPKHHDQRAQARRMKPAAGVAHDGNDLRHGGWVGRVAPALVAGERPAWKPGTVGLPAVAAVLPRHSLGGKQAQLSTSSDRTGHDGAGVSRSR